MQTAEEPSPRDWDLLLSLAGTGLEECPWSWQDSTEWPPGWEREQFEAVIDRCYGQLRREGKTG